MNLFYDDYKITKPLKLIELFAGYGSQAMAFDKIGAKYEHHFVCEFDKYAIKSYNAVHGTNFEPMDIRNVTGKDLNIHDTDKYCYFLTYSFPCTDISNAGKMEAVKDGLKKGSHTISGLLWEVERLLNECEELPQILFMENVPGTVNLEGFEDWCRYLEKKGYMNFCQILNSKDYGVPQNRERAFMFSFLAECDYEFPKPVKLEKRLKDVLEDKVDEKYYLKSEKAQELIKKLVCENKLPKEKEGIDLCLKSVSIMDYANMIKSRYDAGIVNFPKDNTGVIEKIPCQLDKMKDGMFLSLNDASICKVGTEISSTITSRYYKGVGANHDNMVIEKTVCEERVIEKNE